jgi:hypothetical protein
MTSERNFRRTAGFLGRALQRHCHYERTWSLLVRGIPSELPRCCSARFSTERDLGRPKSLLGSGAVLRLKTSRTTPFTMNANATQKRSTDGAPVNAGEAFFEIATPNTVTPAPAGATPGALNDLPLFLAGAGRGQSTETRRSTPTKSFPAAKKYGYETSEENRKTDP